jgi:Polyketide cyclase / dehydrase and lipid transport
VITFETEVRIERPIEEVYAYVSDPLNFPRWNSAVQRSARTSEVELFDGAPASNRSCRERDGDPGSRAGRESSQFARLRGPTPFLYRYLFSSAGGDTLVKLDAQVELHGAAAVLPHLAR